MRRAGPILIVLIGVLALIVNFVPGLRIPDRSSPDGWRTVETRLGLDLEGGLRVEYRAIPNDGESPTPEGMEVLRQIIERRVNASGVAEPVVVVQGSDRIVVELPGASDIDAVRSLVGQTGQLYFIPLGTTSMAQGQIIDLEQFPPLFGGDQLESAAVGTDSTAGGLTVNFVLKSEGAELFADYTRNNIGRYFAIVLDNEVISAPVINQAIPNGQVQISAGGMGGFTAQDANDLVTVLKYGTLPFAIEELSSEQISATLGETFLTQSLLAGLIGILLVMAFMIIYYRVPGIVACFALVYYTLVVYAIFRLVPVTLTLAGIAGFVLSIGMAVDANILIFERMKEEVRAGKTLPAAVEAGFNRAWNSILDSNVSSLITATILYSFGSSTIRGFALVLIIGVLISMFSAITVTRTILREIVRRGWARSPTLYGLRADEYIAHAPTRPSRRAARADV
jgi:protein-export SecD/SecF family membrane protein